MDHTAAESPAPDTSVPLPGLPSRILLLVTAPGKLFRALRDQPTAWAALLTGALLTAGSTLAIPPEVFADFVRDQMLRNGGEIPPQLAQMGRLQQILGAVAALVFWPLGALVQAALFSGIFLFGFGFEGRFRQYFAVGAHAMLIVAVAGLLLLPIRIATGTVDFSPSLEGFVPFLEEGLIYRWFSLLDLFGMWSFALVGMGAGAIDGKGREGLGAAVAVGAAALLMLLIASLTG